MQQISGLYSANSPSFLWDSEMHSTAFTWNLKDFPIAPLTQTTNTPGSSVTAGGKTMTLKLEEVCNLLADSLNWGTNNYCIWGLNPQTAVSPTQTKKLAQHLSVKTSLKQRRLAHVLLLSPPEHLAQVLIAFAVLHEGALQAARVILLLFVRSSTAWEAWDREQARETPSCSSLTACMKCGRPL